MTTATPTAAISLDETIDTEWHTRAACRGRSSCEPSRPWSHTHAAAEAAAYCQGCPVMAQCARQALDTNARGVIMGGVVVGLTNNGTWRARLETVARRGDMGG